jgi:peptide/nickel transport system substrate-binding protein
MADTLMSENNLLQVIEMIRRNHIVIASIFLLTLLTACNAAPTPVNTPTITLTPTMTRTPVPTATPTVTPTPAPPPSTHPEKLVYLTAYEPQTLDPQVDYTSAGAGVFHNLYETLLTYNKSNPANFVPLLADFIPEAVVAEDGNVSYTFVIPRDRQFHNGEDVTPEDVAYSLWRALLLARSDRGGSFVEANARTPGFLLLDAFFGVDDAALLVDASGKFVGDPEYLRMAKADALLAACNQVKGAVTFDNAGRSVTLKLPRPYAPLFAALAGPWASVVQKKWMADQGEWDGDCRTWQYFYGTRPEQGLIRDKANGTGPYQLDHWTPDAEIVLTGNPNYRQGAPKIDRVEIKTIGNFEQRLQMLLARDADLIETTSAEEQARLDKLVREKCDTSGQCDTLDFNGSLREYVDLPSIARHNVFFNFALPKGSVYAGSGQLDGQGVPLDFFSDVHVRRAFNACFDRSAFITDTLAGKGEVPLAITLPDQPGYADTPAAGFDLAQCAEEFEAVEFKTTDDRSLWDTGFALTLPYRDDDAVQQAVVENLAANVAKVNAQFVITPVPLSALDWQRELRTGQVPLAAIGWQEDVDDPHNWYRPYLLDTYTTQFNLPDELAAKYRALIDQGAAVLDGGARAATYAALNTALSEDAALILLPYTRLRRYEPLYLKGWLNGMSMNPLIPDPGYVYEYRER